VDLTVIARLHSSVAHRKWAVSTRAAIIVHRQGLFAA
jgi:hypothetical protein